MKKLLIIALLIVGWLAEILAHHIKFTYLIKEIIMSEQPKDDKHWEKYRKPKESRIFLGCMFVGIGFGFLFEHIPAGAMIGMGIGFILQQLYSKSSN